MSKTALLIRHTAKPGMRDALKRVWEKYARDYVAGNGGHPAYFYCFDDADPDAVVAFQLHADPHSAQDFMQQPWYADYKRESADLLAGPSEFRRLTPQWMKGVDA